MVIIEENKIGHSSRTSSIKKGGQNTKRQMDKKIKEKQIKRKKAKRQKV